MLMARYLIHVIGDMHQPLHNTNFYNNTFTEGDMGGIIHKCAIFYNSFNKNQNYYLSSPLLKSLSF